MLPHSASSSQSRQTLSEVIEIYISDRSAHWSAKTKAEFAQYLSTLLSLIGDKPNPDISRSNCIACRSKLQSLPPNFTKKKQVRGMSAKEIAEGSVSGQSLSSKTVNKYLTLLSSFFKWAIKKGAISSNPAEGLLLSQSKSASEEREVYSLEDIQLIQAKLPRLDNEPEKFWIPMIAMYSGMRMDEICQLHKEDIQIKEDVYCFNIHAEGVRKLKTTASSRLVPIHPELISVGLIEYVEQGETNRLWTNLSPDQFGRWGLNCKIVRPLRFPGWPLWVD